LCLFVASNNPDIIFLTETWLHSEISDTLINISNYKLLRDDRVNKRGGGVCVYINEGCAWEELIDLNKPVEIEAKWVSAYKTIFCVIYIPPAYQYKLQNEISQYIIENFDTFNKTHPNFSNICLGDFNCFQTNFLESQLAMEMIIKGATRCNSLLDKIFVSNCSDLFSVNILDPLQNSDHNKILVTCDKDVIYKQRLRLVYDFRSSNLAKFVDALKKANFSPIYQTNNINEKVSIFYNVLIDCLNVIPRKHIPTSKNDKPWMTAILKSMITQRWNAYRRRDFERYEALKIKVKLEIQQSKKSYYSKLLSKRNNSIWNIIRDNTSLSCASFKFSGTDKDLASEINNNLRKIVFQPKKSYEVDVDVNKGNEITFAEEEVRDVLIKINPKKASSDPIPSSLFIFLAQYCTEAIAHIFNSVSLSKMWPKQWKLANIIPLPKDKTSDPLNVRPISILSALNKCLEQLIKRQLLPHYIQHIDDSQYGFIPMGSTTSAIIALLNKIHFSLDRPEIKAVSVISFDFTKAFDKVNHQILLNKLSVILPPKLVHILSSYLKERKQRVKINDSYSDYCNIDCGVPQGSVLSPLLFGLFIRDLISTPKSFCIKYADDSTYVIPHYSTNITEDIRDTFVHVHNWCKNNKLELNLKKTKLLIIKKQNVVYDTVFSLSPVNEVKILGLTFQNDLKWNKQVALITKSASSSLYLIRKCRSIFNQKQLILLYNSYVLSKLCYASPSYAFLPQSLQKYFIKLHKRSHHIICGTECKKNCLIPPLDQIKKTSFKLFQNIMQNAKHPLHSLIPAKLKYSRKLMLPLCRSERSKCSFIPQMALLYNSI